MKTTLKLTFLITLGAIFALSASGQSIKFSSVYTDFKKDCKDAFKSVDEGQDMPLICKGYGGYRVNVGYSAWASMISIGKKNSETGINLASQAIDFTDIGRKLEWRLANGKPFAVILRINIYKDDQSGDNPFENSKKSGESILIKGLPGYESIDSEIDAKKKNANIEARKIADSGFKK